MKLIYLGWPRCGSSWLHKVMQANADLKDLNDEKESHLFYTDPDRALELFQEGMMDFSTNNWSMDSWVAERLQDATFVMIHRHPIEQIKSYHCKMKNDWAAWQTACRFNKLLAIGDVLERWLRFTKGNLLLYEFEDLQADPVTFGSMVLRDLGYEPKHIDPARVLASANVRPLEIEPDLLQTIEIQEHKFQELARSTTYRRLLSR